MISVSLGPKSPESALLFCLLLLLQSNVVIQLLLPLIDHFLFSSILFNSHTPEYILTDPSRHVRPNPTSTTIIIQHQPQYNLPKKHQHQQQ